MSQAVSEELIDRVSAYVAERMGLYFPKERRNDLERGLRRAAPDLGFKDAEACGRWLLLSSVTKAQIEILASHLTVGETYFFRDKTSFDLLESSILPDLVQKRRSTGRQLRIWSAGCATGEEAYSVAILLKRLIPDIREWNITILATDINPLFLGRAARGVYGDWSFRDVPSWIQERYFKSAGPGKFALLPDIRKSVTFAYHNLAEDPYPSLSNNTNAMDIVFCRNVLMYFSRDRQAEVVRKLCQCLIENGLLVMSPAEISAALCSPLQARFTGSSIYHKNTPGTAPPDHAPLVEIPVQRFQHGVPFAPTIDEVLKKPAGVSLSAVPKKDVPGNVAVPKHDPYQEAVTFYKNSRYPEAEEALAKFLAGDQHDAAPAFALLARIRANRGKLDEALDLCGRAISANKLNPGYYYLSATILQELGRVEESAASFKRAIYLDQNFVLAHFSLGTIALHQGKTREADKHFENARQALRNHDHDEILPESEGVTAGRMEEIILSTLKEEALL